MSLSSERIAKLSSEIAVTLTGDDSDALRRVYGINPFADYESEKSYKIFAEKSQQLPEALRQKFFNVLTLLNPEQAANTAVGTAAMGIVNTSMLKYFPEKIIEIYADYQNTSDSERNAPEYAYAATIDKNQLEKAAHAAPFYYYNEYLSDYEEEPDTPENEKPIPIDWKSYSNEQLVALANISDADSVIGSLSKIEDRSNIAEIIAASAENDPRNTYTTVVIQLNEKPYQQATLEAIVGKTPSLLFDNYAQIKKTAPAVLDTYLKPENLAKLDQTSDEWGSAFLNSYYNYQNETFTAAVADKLAEKNPATFFDKFRVETLHNIDHALLTAVHNEPALALIRMSGERLSLKLSGAQGTIKDEAIAHMQSYLDRNVGQDTNAELMVVRRLNTLHNEKHSVRYESVTGLNTSGYYQLITEGRSEAYTSTYNHLYSGFVSRLGKDNKGFSEFLHESPDRLKNLPSFIEGLSTFGQFNNFIGRLGPEEKELLTSTIADQLTEDPLNVVSAANFIRNLPPGDPSLKLMESRILEGYATSEGSKKDMYGVLGRWYADSPKHKVSPENIEAFNTFKANERFKMPDFERVEPALLFDSSKRHFQLHVFYNDEDGQVNYAQFEKRMANEGWASKINKETGVAHFEKTQDGRQIHIYATATRSDGSPNNDSAVEAIKKEVADQGGKITFVAHRGHSYYVDDTIKHLDRNVEVLFLGACGGTQFIQTSLDKSPNADIIATTGTGTRNVNEPLLAAINQKIIAAQPIVWSDMKAVTAGIKDARAEEYMMPNENMAAIFISKLNELEGKGNLLSQDSKSNLNQSFSEAHDGIPAPAINTAPAPHQSATMQMQAAPAA